MARINVIDPQFLTDQHLQAEYWEILLAVNMLKKVKNEDIPEHYQYGPGHIIFFKYKILFLKNRFDEIKSEAQNRGINTKAELNVDDFPLDQLNDWKPSIQDMVINIQKLFQQIQLKPYWYKYYKHSLPEWMLSFEKYKEKVLTNLT